MHTKEMIEFDVDAANKFYEKLTLPKWKHISPQQIKDEILKDN